MKQPRKLLNVYCADLENCTMRQCHEAAAKRAAQTLSFSRCWHCNDTKRCDCMFCAMDVQVGTCLFCKPQVPIPDGIDVRDILNWELFRPEAPAKPFRRLKHG